MTQPTIDVADLDQAVDRDRRTGPAAVLTRAAPALSLLGFSFAAAVQTEMTAVSLLPLLALAALAVLYYCRAPLGGIRAVPFACAIALLAAVLSRGLPAALAPAAIIVAVIWADADHRRVRPDRDGLLAVGGALVLGLVLSGLMVGPLSPRGGGGGTGAATTGRQSLRREPTAESSFVERLLRAITRLLTGDGAGTAVDPTSGSPPPPPDPDPVNWLRLLIAVLIVAVLIALLLLMWHLVKRFLSARHDDRAVFELVRRYDRVGARTLRARRTSEGLAHYGRAVSTESGDHRVAATGELISEVLYNPGSSTGGGASAAVDDLESNPPPLVKPTRRWWRRRGR